ncbi:MAG: FtsQ-type POTRA domain-containing protein [Ruminococcaceae bacterium]|nr:FtsQ-type POTRA domain-containing protein [Oscillospiraceae bacterium]
MGLFKKQAPHGYEGESLIEEIYGSRTEREISEIEKNAERVEAYEMMRSRKRRRGFLRAFAIILILSVLTIAVIYTGYSFLFVIDEINVVGDSPYTDAEISEGAGVNPGDKLFSFSSVKAEKLLMANLPYIGSLQVERNIPDKVTLTVKSESPVYYTEIYGKIYLMSETLRILGEGGDADLAGLTRLRLTGVKEAVFGSVPVMRNKTAQEQLQSVTECINSSSLAGRITQIDLRNIYRLEMVCDNKYLLEFGEFSEVDTKLRIASAVLEDEMFKSSNKARIDLRDLSETIVVVDNQLDFDK